jgi:hypothetical protein
MVLAAFASHPPSVNNTNHDRNSRSVLVMQETLTATWQTVERVSLPSHLQMVRVVLDLLHIVAYLSLIQLHGFFFEISLWLTLHFGRAVAGTHGLWLPD